MEVYELLKYGRLPEKQIEEELDPDAEEAQKYGYISLGVFADINVAKRIGEETFLADPDEHCHWIKEARVWHLPRPGQGYEKDLYLWSMLPSAAGSVIGDWYPQARTTPIRIKTISVIVEEVSE